MLTACTKTEVTTSNALVPLLKYSALLLVGLLLVELPGCFWKLALSSGQEGGPFSRLPGQKVKHQPGQFVSWH